MRRHVVIWKKVSFRNRLGSNFDADLADIIDSYNRGALLSQIVQMPGGSPIDFDSAIRMVGERFFNSVPGHSVGQKQWYLANFVMWMTMQGYKIELTGDEFSIPIMPADSCV